VRVEVSIIAKRVEEVSKRKDGIDMVEWWGVRRGVNWKKGFKREIFSKRKSYPQESGEFARTRGASENGPSRCHRRERMNDFGLQK
jgi:hypothetical protein